MTRDEAVIRARFTINPETLYKINFLTNGHGDVDSLAWAHDLDSPPEIFQREGDYVTDFQKPLAM